jgi:hypothetical protein
MLDPDNENEVISGDTARKYLLAYLETSPTAPLNMPRFS